MMRMFILISYDVATDTAAGRRRLRKVARACESNGQRVQKSVFECRLTEMQLEEMERTLVAIINEQEDNLRLYRMSESANWNVKQYGVFRSRGFDDPLVV
jgi:CRISPR-associated protein Cas2